MMSKLGLLLTTMVLLSAGCGAVDRELDCRKICDKKKECVDNNYNVSNCVSSCKSNAESNATYGQKVNDCSACIETRACAQVSECYLKDSCPSLP